MAFAVQTEQWVCCWTDSRYWTPVDCLYNRHPTSLQVGQKELFGLSNADRQGGTVRHSSQAEAGLNVRTFILNLSGYRERSGKVRKKVGNKAGKPDRRMGDELATQSQWARMGDEKLSFSSCAVADVTGGSEKGGGEWRHLRIKEEHRKYEFDLWRKGQQGLTFDICKDTVAPRPLINTDTYKAVSHRFQSRFSLFHMVWSASLTCTNVYNKSATQQYFGLIIQNHWSLSNWETTCSPRLFILLVFWSGVCSLVGSHISTTIKIEQQSTKLLLTLSTELNPPPAARSGGKKIHFSFPSDTKKKILR